MGIEKGISFRIWNLSKFIWGLYDLEMEGF